MSSDGVSGKIHIYPENNQTLPKDGMLIGQTTGRGKDPKGRLIVAYPSVSANPTIAAQSISGSSNQLTGGRSTNEISYAIMGPAAKVIQNISDGSTNVSKPLNQVEAQKLSSEWKWLPDFFKKTFMVKVGDNYYDINASSLEKAFGITKQQIHVNNRDLTQLIQTEAQKRFKAALKLDAGLAPLSTSKTDPFSALNIENPAILKNLYNAASEARENSVTEYLNKLQVTTDPSLTIGQLREKNPAQGAQEVINEGLRQHLTTGRDLLTCLMFANTHYKIPAEINLEIAQAASTAAIEAANTKAQGINSENGITTTSPNTTQLKFDSIRELRKGPVLKLDEGIFSKTYGIGVQKLIEESRTQFEGNPSTRTIVQAASQYNGAEAGEAFTPLVGLESEFAKGDRTQGPQAQLMEQDMFQAITAAANRGFNAIASVLSEDTLRTYEKTNVHVSGYLQVGGHKELTIAVTEDFCKNGNNLQSPVLKNKGHDLVLSAAPSWQNSQFGSDFEEAKDLAYAAAYYNFSALFEQGLKRLREEPITTNIRICPVPIGCGAFANDPASVAKAFNAAALNFQNALTPEQKKRVKVEMQIFKPNAEGLKPGKKGFEANLGIDNPLIRPS